MAKKKIKKVVKKVGKKIKRPKKVVKVLKLKKPIAKKAKPVVAKKISIQKNPQKKVHHDLPVATDNSFFKPRIKVIGIGGGGGSIVSDMGKSLSKATFMVADTDLRSFKKKGKIKYFVFGQ